MANTAVGNQALLANTTGNSNSAFGYESLKSNSIRARIHNSAFGFRSLHDNTLGAYNTGMGGQALMFIDKCTWAIVILASVIQRYI